MAAWWCFEEPECMLESLAWWIFDAVLLCPSLLLPEVTPVAWLLERSIAEFFLRRDCY